LFYFLLVFTYLRFIIGILYQRTKPRELEQRAKQLREEEEERTRKQKAKALAKLEELNRKQSTEGSMHKSGFM
jgi:cell division protein FtsL